MDDQNNPVQTPQDPTTQPAAPTSGGMPMPGGMGEPAAPQAPTPEPTAPEPTVPTPEPTGGMGGTMPSAGDAPANPMGGPAMPGQPAAGEDVEENKQTA